MKLNNKRTVLVGLAFLSICAFWQMYDSVIPLMLTKTFHLHETYSGLRDSFRQDDCKDGKEDAVHRARHGSCSHTAECSAAYR